MTVSTIAAVATNSTRAISNQNTKASLSLSASVSASQARSSDTQTITYPSELQKQGASLRVLAQGISQTSAQLDSTSSGASEISSLASQLQGIATRASSSGLSDSQRESLNSEFQALREKINNVATGKTFNGTPLLTKSSSGEAAPSGIDGLSDVDLFGNAGTLDLTTQEAAQKALTAVNNALDSISTQQAIITTAQAENEYAAATVESAVQNQEASRSTLTENDITTGTSTSASASVQGQSADALIAQTNRLPADILRLLAD